MNRIRPSIHALEIFNPVVNYEEFFLKNYLSYIPSIPFYKGVELGVFMNTSVRKEVRKMVEQNNYQLTTWLSPTLIGEGLNLSSLDSDLRKKSVSRAKELIALAAETGTTHCGVPCGPDNKEHREDAQKALEDSWAQMLEEMAKYNGVDMTFEALDRDSSKFMLVGPITEAIEIIGRLNKKTGKIFSHWDSAHELLNGFDLFESIEVAKPYLAQIHLTDAITDRSHPYFGDLHMDMGHGPEWKAQGVMTPSLSAKLLKKVLTFDKCDGVKDVYCAVEMRSALGEDLWEKERIAREYLQEVFKLAGIEV